MQPETARFVAFAFAGADLLVEAGRDGTIRFAVGAGQRIASLRADDLPGRSLAALFGEADREAVEALLASLKPGQRIGPLTLRLDGAGATPVLVNACSWPGLDGRISCTLAKTADAPATAGRDADTQLYDADSFRALAETLSGTAAQLGEPSALTLVTIHGLETIEERVERETAQRLVRKVAGYLRSRSVQGAAAGRLGPDRFGIIQREPASSAEIAADVEAIAKRCAPEAGITVEAQDVALGVQQLSLRQTLRAVGYVLDRFRLNGETAPESLDAALEASVSRTVGRISDFQQIVRGAKFNIVYQPVVALENGRLHHYEALTRFRGNESPFEIIRFAEDLDIIETFDLTVLGKVIKRLQDEPQAAPVAVNLSGRSIESDGFVAVILRLLDMHAALRDRLVFEITESAGVTDLPRGNRIIQELRRRGFGVCIDDFGAGASSFHYLQAMQVDAVKIDGSLVSRIGESDRDEALVRHIARLCTDLGIETIAEMIESQAMADRAFALGVRFGQGWHFGKPSATLRPADAGVPSIRDTVERIRARR